MSNPKQLLKTHLNKSNTSLFQKKYNFPVNDKTRNGFARYFAGFQRFIETGKGKKIGFEIANFNGILILKLYTDNNKDLEQMDIWVSEFIQQASDFMQNGNLGIFTIQADYPITEYDAKLTIVEQKSRIRDLESDLETGNLRLEQKNEEILKLNQIVINKEIEIQKLTDDNITLLDKITQIRNNLLETRIKNIVVDDKIDTLLSYLSMIATGLDNQDQDQVQVMTNAVKDFWVLNKDKLMLIQISGNTLYQLLKTIFKF